MVTSTDRIGNPSVECGGVKTKGARCRQGSRSGADCGSRPECADQATLNGALVELPPLEAKSGEPDGSYRAAPDWPRLVRWNFGQKTSRFEGKRKNILLL
jgi:hypothetical protein